MAKHVEMACELDETEFLEDGIKYFYFFGREELEDFEAMCEIAREYLKPEVFHYKPIGWGETGAYFVKNGVRMEVWNDFTGNELQFHDTGRPEDVETVRRWAKLIWDILQRDYPQKPAEKK